MEKSFRQNGTKSTQPFFAFKLPTLTLSDSWTCRDCGQPHFYFEPVECPRLCVNCGGFHLKSEHHPVLRLLGRLGNLGKSGG